MMIPQYFASAIKFHHWLEKNHARSIELWVGFYKRSSGKAGITYQEALDEALCCGWIDGIRKAVDESRIVHAFVRERRKKTPKVFIDRLARPHRRSR